MTNKHIPAAIACALAVVLVFIFGRWLDWDGLLMTVSPDKLVGLLSPIAFAAAAVERGVEIMISPWRDGEAAKLGKNLAAAKTRNVPPTAEGDAAIKTASDKLDDYRGATQQYAFAVSLVLSVLVSTAGVRALGPFLDAKNFTAPAATFVSQHTFFVCVDVVVSAMLLSGGADGVHSFVNMVTSFFNASADKVSKT